MYFKGSPGCHWILFTPLVISRFYVQGVLQERFKHSCCGGDNDRAEGDKDAHKNSACTIITVAQHNKNLSYRNKTDSGYRANFYCLETFHGRLREGLILSDVSQHLECLIERHEKWNGPYIRIRQKGILEIDLKERGVRVSAFDVRFPKHESKSANANEHNDCPKKYRWNDERSHFHFMAAERLAQGRAAWSEVLGIILVYVVPVDSRA